jgi:hypothetical protein
MIAKKQWEVETSFVNLHSTANPESSKAPQIIEAPPRMA